MVVCVNYFNGETEIVKIPVSGSYEVFLKVLVQLLFEEDSYSSLVELTYIVVKDL